MPEIVSTSVSEAWLAAVRLACAPRQGREISHLTVVIDGIKDGQVDEDLKVRKVLNESLQSNGKASVETVSRTIFPSGLWNPARPRTELYERFFNILPAIRRCKKNPKGHYFERMVSFPGELGKRGLNQLEYVIDSYNHDIHRRTALQICLMNPHTDLTRQPYLKFPCLQQLALLPDEPDLSLLAFYPLHYLYQRAYGNYLGLIALGHFMAEGMGLRLRKVICTAGTAQIEHLKSAECTNLLKRC